MFSSNKPKIANFRADYATTVDFCDMFINDTKHLYLLAFLLTANHQESGQCFVSTVEEAFKGQAVFKEWVRSWLRRTLIENAIKIVSPASARNGRERDFWSAWQPGTQRECEIDTVTKLASFERFVFVMSILERYSDWDCSVLLGCCMNKVSQARMRALRGLSDLAALFPRGDGLPSRHLEVTASTPWGRVLRSNIKKFCASFISMAIAARQMKTTATTNLDYRRTRFVKKNRALQVLLLSMCAPFLTLWSGAQSTQDAAMSSATAGSSSASPTEQQEMRDELRALRAEVELLRAAVEQQRHTTLANDHGELVPEATTGAGPNVRSLRASVAEGVGKAEPVAAASSPPQGTGGLQGWLAQNPSTSSDAASAEAGEASTWDEFPRRVPIEKYRAKTSAFEVVTKSNPVHSGC